MEIDEVLAKATPRPWRITDLVERPDRANDAAEVSSARGPYWIAHCQQVFKNDHVAVDANANTELIVTAVNAYERQRAVIAELSKALESVKGVLAVESAYTVKRSDGEMIELPEAIRIGNIFEKADAALAHAQELDTPEKQEEGK